MKSRSNPMGLLGGLILALVIAGAGCRSAQECKMQCCAPGRKMIVVIGHSNCGAIKGAVDNVELGNLTGLLARVKPAIDKIPDDGKPRNSKNYDFVEKVSEANVRVVMQQIREKSPVLREMLDKGQIGLVGGMYDLQTGEVKFY